MKYLMACLSIGLIFWGACSPSPSTSTVTLAKVVIALKPDKNPEQMLEERKGLEAYLGEKLGKPVEVIVPLSSAVIIEGMVNGSIDLSYLSATDLINAQKKQAADILLAGEIEGKPYYMSYWVALKDKPYTKVEDLRGLKVAFSSKTSTSGMTIPLWDLHQKGFVGDAANPEEFFGKGNVFYGTGYVSAVEQVLNGQAEAAAVSYYVLDKDKHLTLEQRQKLKKVTEQGPVPTHVIAIRRAIGGSEREELKKALLSLNNVEQQELRDKLFTSKLIESEYKQHLGDLPQALNYVTQQKP
jgi:phosphonate transport system substrate-binding protein